MSYNFDGKNILVTGAGRGIGQGIAKTLARSGAKVYAFSKTKANLDSLIKEVPSIQPIHLNFQDWGDTSKVVDNIAVLDGLVNNAGIVPAPTDAAKVLKEAIDTIFDVNLKAAINVMQVVGKKMTQAGKGGSIVNVSSMLGHRAYRGYLPKKMTQAGKGGSIVNVSSMLGHRAYRGYLPYCVSKAGLNMATKMFALELGKYKIRVNSFNPAGVRTENVEKYGQAAIKHATSRMPIGRICEIEDVVDGVLFLLSDKSQMITGTDVSIDGGYMCYLPV